MEQGAPPHTNLRLSVSGCPSVRTLSPPRHNSPGPSVVHPPTCIHRIFNSDPRAIDLKSASLQSTYAKKLAALCSTVVCQSCQHIFQQFCAQLDNYVYSKPKIFLSHRTNPHPLFKSWAESLSNPPTPNNIRSASDPRMSGGSGRCYKCSCI